MDRATLTLGEVIGQGQFGAVHRGEWRAKDGTRVQVAIKTCNGQGIAKREIQEQYTTGDELTEDDGADKLLDEARVYLICVLSCDSQWADKTCVFQ